MPTLNQIFGYHYKIPEFYLSSAYVTYSVLDDVNLGKINSLKLTGVQVNFLEAFKVFSRHPFSVKMEQHTAFTTVKYWKKQSIT